jgi:hypothetical protein
VLVAAAVVAVLGVVAGVVIASGRDAEPLAFGTLGTDPDRAADEVRAGVRVAMMELSWAAYEPANGRFDDTYGRQARGRLDRLRSAGLQVTLGLGLHFTPAWVQALPDSRFVDQHGTTSAEVNLVFNQKLRLAAEKYLARVNQDLDLSTFWAIRLTSGGLSEVLYPAGGSFWAFDRNAQNGPDLPPGMARNPEVGWRPGDRALPAARVRRWADWYVHGLDDVVRWQIRTLDSFGFRGYYQLLTPGSGTRPDRYDTEIAAFLPDGVTGVGAVWHRFYADLALDRVVARRVVAYVSSMADRSGGDDSCTGRDTALPVTDPALDSWSAARWVARLARAGGFRVNGENPGWNQPPTLNAHYTDGGSNGMMTAAVRQAVSCGFQGMYWAHDENLWHGPASMPRFAALIAQANANDGGSRTPPMP